MALLVQMRRSNKCGSVRNDEIINLQLGSGQPLQSGPKEFLCKPFNISIIKLFLNDQDLIYILLINSISNSISKCKKCNKYICSDICRKILK